ncbi:MAG: hypothetical protein ACPGU1_05300 [Myxococcota bacterium]
MTACFHYGRSYGACAALALVLFVGGSPPAEAQCTGAGVAVGSCTMTTSYAGCCGDFSQVLWCENGVQCALDCVQNLTTGTHSCCEASSFGDVGCCDATVAACVCALDTYCCSTVWDDICASQVISFGCGICPAACPAPAQYCGWSSQGYYDCSPSPSADPSGQNPSTCGGDTGGGGDPTCSCAGKECGDDGCGGQCGSCTFPEQCDAWGQCGEQSCQGDCFGKQCGDDGCGGSCGTCPAQEVCTNFVCTSACNPNCLGKQCGDDGCGGSCGTCQAGLFCHAGSCAEQCDPDCSGKVCGDDGCGGSCGGCFGGTVCDELGLCVVPEDCEPDCIGKSCGEDGCGGYCGNCPAGWACQAGTCLDPCVPNCGARQCGPDSCGGSCGTCVSGWGCDSDGFCYEGCDADCVDRACGDDGCGGLCGTCAVGASCELETGECVDSSSTDGGAGTPDGNDDCSCEGRECGDDGCGGSCGTCPDGLICTTALGRCATVYGDGDDDGDDAEASVSCGPDEVWNALVGDCVLSDEGGIPSGGDAAQGCTASQRETTSWWGLLLVGLAIVWRRRGSGQPWLHRTCRS